MKREKKIYEPLFKIQMNVYTTCIFICDNIFLYILPLIKEEEYILIFERLFADIPDNECKMLNASPRHLVTRVDLGTVAPVAHCKRVYIPKGVGERDGDRERGS